MPSFERCTDCGAELTSSEQGGLCQRCLLKLGLAAAEEDPSAAGPAGDAPENTTSDIAIERAGTMIGRYKLLEQIGEGGFGVVYMAEQVEPVQRRVALKIIKAGMDTKEVIARFEAERQALALMDHPNIAHVLDAGATELGRPYFVMELVQGIPITEFCDHRQLNTAQRLQLFIQVCHAVQHAHQKGIIHRDLKPSNILVTHQESEPLPKIIDFGVAKALGRKLTEKTLFTGFLRMVGTPAYMSPEQAEFTGMDIDTRSDVYSLGVLLYELLTGVTPFDSETIRKAAFDELRRMIRETEPPKPSTRLQTLGERLREVAKHRHTEPPKLVHSVRGDLDWIVMKCLEKDRRRRYETANGLAMDVQRHLDNEPIVARPPSRLYEFQKTVRRHKFGFAATAAIIVALAGGVVVSSWQAAEAQRAREAERQQRLAAQEARDKALAAKAAEQQQRLVAQQERDKAERRAYAADMTSAARRHAEAPSSLEGFTELLSPWSERQPDLRGWEWYFFNGLFHREEMTLVHGTNGLKCVAWSPDGRRIAASGGGDSVAVWDAESGRELIRLRGHQNEVWAVAWHPREGKLATGGKDGKIVIWDVERGDKLVLLPGYSGSVRSLAWRPDGRQLASASKAGEVKIWDAADGANVQTIPGGGQWVAWHPGGEWLAAADNGVRLWDVNLGREAPDETLNSMGCCLAALAWSADGRWLALGGQGWRVRLWNTERSELSSEFSTYNPWSLAWSPDGRVLATGNQAGFVRTWDPFTGALQDYFRGHLQGVSSVAWHPDGRRIASASYDGTVRVWDLTRPDPSLRVLRQNGQVDSVAWHPDGRWLAASSSEGEIRLWDTRGNEATKLLGRHDGRVWRITWNPSGTHLASGGNDGFVKLWDAAAGREVWSVQVGPEAVRGLAWNPLGTQIAATGTSSKITILDATGNTINRFRCRGEPLALAWSPDGRHLLTQYQTLDAATGAQLRFKQLHQQTVRDFAGSPDGRWLASCADDSLVKIWDLETGEELQTLYGHSLSVYRVAWSPDGTRLATGSFDRSIKIWNPGTGQLICSLDRQDSGILSVAWSPDGQRLAAGDLDGRIFIYDSRPGRAH